MSCELHWGEEKFSQNAVRPCFVKALPYSFSQVICTQMLVSKGYSMRREKLGKSRNWTGGLLSLALLLGGVQAWGGGLSLAGSLAARKFNQVVDQIAGNAKYGDLASNTRTISVSMKNALEAGDDTAERS